MPFASTFISVTPFLCYLRVFLHDQLLMSQKRICPLSKPMAVSPLLTSAMQLITPKLSFDSRYSLPLIGLIERIYWSYPPAMSYPWAKASVRMEFFISERLLMRFAWKSLTKYQWESHQGWQFDLGRCQRRSSCWTSIIILMNNEI
jgi:hypothetical protein